MHTTTTTTTTTPAAAAAAAAAAETTTTTTTTNTIGLSHRNLLRFRLVLRSQIFNSDNRKQIKSNRQFLMTTHGPNVAESEVTRAISSTNETRQTLNTQ